MIVAGGAAAMARQAATPDNWKIYVNVRYGYQICYPPTLLKPQREADNSDGRAFTAADGAVLVVFGSNNIDGTALSAEALSQASDYTGKLGRITYRAAKDNWIVLSGDNGHGISFYNKTFRRFDQFITFKIKYNTSLNQKYRPLLEQISSCFRISDKATF